MENRTQGKSGLDGFKCASGSSYATQHALIDEWLKNSEQSSLARESGKMQKDGQVRLLLACMERMEFQKSHGYSRAALTHLIKPLAGRKLPYTEEQIHGVIASAAKIMRPADPGKVSMEELDMPIPGVLPLVLEWAEASAKTKALSTELLAVLGKLHAALKPMEFWAGYKKTVQRLEALLEQKRGGVPEGNEAWAQAIRNEIEQMKPKQRACWQALLENAPKGTTAKPTAKWKKEADELLAAVGQENFAKQVEHWFALVGAKAAERIEARDASLLRALVWYASLLTGETVCRALANAVEGGLRKLPNGGLYASSISKACIAALETMPGLEPVAQLSRLKHRVKSPWGQEEIQKAFTNAVQRTGLSADEVEEITLPSFGLDGQGKLKQAVGRHTAELQIENGREVAIYWSDESEKRMEKLPTGKSPGASEAKALKQLASDIEKMLSAQRDRVERLLNTERTWVFSVWSERYLNHPLMAQLSRRLIWHFREGSRHASAIWTADGVFKQSDGKTVEWISPKTEVRLWHPLGAKVEEVQRWRIWLENHEVMQPFKQAHRELYVITDAEQTTRTYSNRFAAHILRQHQFKALCDQRGWHYEFLGSWDNCGNTGASVNLPQWKLQAQLWLDVGGDEFADSGVALYVSTDQVRFCREDGEVVELTEVPALAFTEIMRDVDFFVSVCSVANDPAWQDQGDAGQRDYWRTWAFGDLMATAETRRDLLGRLLPKLKISRQCSLDGKFLKVKGRLRTYKIHLGSGNILMEPNDQYLCIVPDRKPKAGNSERVMLPFEGDNMLSIILSKAFLLAADFEIKDETILRQIKQ